MTNRFGVIEACIGKCAVGLCGSGKTATIAMGMILGTMGLMIAGLQYQPSTHYLVPNVTVKAGILLLISNILLMWGILINKAELVKMSNFLAGGVAFPMCLVGCFVYGIFKYDADGVFPPIIITFAVAIPFHVAFVQELLREMDCQTSSLSKYGLFQQNLTVSSQEEVKKKENLAQDPAVLAQMNSDEIHQVHTSTAQ